MFAHPATPAFRTAHRRLFPSASPCSVCAVCAFSVSFCALEKWNGRERGGGGGGNKNSRQRPVCALHCTPQQPRNGNPASSRSENQAHKPRKPRAQVGRAAVETQFLEVRGRCSSSVGRRLGHSSVLILAFRQRDESKWKSGSFPKERAAASSLVLLVLTAEARDTRPRRRRHYRHRLPRYPSRTSPCRRRRRRPRSLASVSGRCSYSLCGARARTPRRR